MYQKKGGLDTTSLRNAWKSWIGKALSSLDNSGKRGQKCQPGTKSQEISKPQVNQK
jgi:hypothetical protein